MAKPKKRKKVSGVRRRRKRMSGMSPVLADVGMKLLGAGLGAGAAIIANQFVKTSFATMPSYLGGVAGVALGVGGLVFGGRSSFVDGASVGAIGMGAVFVVNETFLSLPGISGIPQGVPNARPIPGNYLSNSVAGYRGFNMNPGMGNLSGGTGRSVAGMAGIYRN